MVATPHYLLFSEASCSAARQSWRFVLQDVESSRRMVVADEEAMTCGERLELLAVVRGLEALDGPARVTLVTRSRYVSRGLRSGITEWRANDWHWERFGRIVPVKDHDLWQRVDRALLYHQVECQAWQFEEASTTDEPLSSHDSSGGPQRTCNPSSPCDHSSHAAASPARVSSRLAPTKRRAAAVRRRRNGSNELGGCQTTGGLSAALAGKAATLREAFQAVVSPMRQFATGAA